MKTIQIEGMSCAHCAASVTKALECLPGVKNVHVSLEGRQATFELTDPSVTDGQLREAVEDIGFDVVAIG